MAKFKAGDIVRCVQEDGYDGITYQPGDTVTVHRPATPTRKDLFTTASGFRGFNSRWDLVTASTDAAPSDALALLVVSLRGLSYRDMMAFVESLKTDEDVVITAADILAGCDRLAPPT